MKKIYSYRKNIFLFLAIAGAGWSVNASAQHGWEQLDPLSKPRMAIVSSAIGQYIYIFGGWVSPVITLADGEIYDTETGISIPTANMSVGLAFPSANVLNDKIYICGGFIDDPTKSNLVQEYDPEQDSWVLKKELPHGIGHQVSEVIDGKLYLTGGIHKGAGYSEFGQCMSLIYDPEMDQWDTIASMNSTLFTSSRNSGRVQASSCVYQGKLYVFGGFRFESADHTYLPNPEVYDPVEDTWTNLAEMILPIAHHTSVVYKNKIYLFGGSTDSNYTYGTSTPSNRVYEYDPAMDTWQEMEPMPLALVATEGHVIGKYLYLVGGDDDSQLGGEEAGQVWRFNLDSLRVKDPITEVEPYQESLQSLQNQPNPFLEITSISYELKEGGAVALEVYDLLGRTAITLVDEEQVPGQYTYTWSADDSEPGIYFCRLKLRGSSHTIKMVKR